ncbi:Aryl-alcohol dehydrogenase [compost metagenome]
MFCGICPSCLKGREPYCYQSFEANFGGSRLDSTNAIRRNKEEIHGHFFGQSSFSTYALATERNVVKVPKDVPLEILGPLGCGFQTGAGAVLNSLKIKPDSRVAIFGVGSVGLASVMASKIVNASTIIVVDVNDERLQLAKELGATDTINIKSTNVAEEVKKITGYGVDYMLEITGRPEMLKLGVSILAPLGTAAQIGGAPAGTEASIDMTSLLLGRTVMGIAQGDSIPQLFIPQLI